VRVGRRADVDAAVHSTDTSRAARPTALASPFPPLRLEPVQVAGLLQLPNRTVHQLQVTACRQRSNHNLSFVLLKNFIIIIIIVIVVTSFHKKPPSATWTKLINVLSFKIKLKRIKGITEIS